MPKENKCLPIYRPTGWPIRIEIPPMRLVLYIKFECKRITRILSVSIKYSMRDLICDVINNCASNIAMGKLSEYDQMLIKNLKRGRDGYHTTFYANFHLNDDLITEFVH